MENGWITLKGELEGYYQKMSAENAVQHLWGVKGVVNEITIKPRVTPSEVKNKIEAARSDGPEKAARGKEETGNTEKMDEITRPLHPDGGSDRPSGVTQPPDGDCQKIE